MKIINEQYKNRCLYEDFQASRFTDAEITLIEYQKDGSVIINFKGNGSMPPFIKFTFLKKKIRTE